VAAILFVVGAAGLPGVLAAQQTLLPTSGSEPRYEPFKWNGPRSFSSPATTVELDYVTTQLRNNCYNYACNKRTDTFALPGRSQPGWTMPAFTCPAVTAAAVTDGLQPVDCAVACAQGSYKKALVVDSIDDPLFPGDDRDFHWYRQDADGLWSHKPGPGKATNLDGSSRPIPDPRTANRKAGSYDYADFCGCFCCNPGVVQKR
jgi:hypothetical protein